MTIWKYRINIICQAVDKDALNALWTVIAPEGDSEVDTFGLPLSPTGEAPITHYGISTAATEDMRIYIEYVYAAELAACVISVQDWRENDYDNLIAANNLISVEVIRE